MIESIGRTATEVKGFRIDLSEVEAALLDGPAVDNCVVLARETETSRQELIAYVVSAGSFSPERLHSYLQAVLPMAMLPNLIMPTYLLR